MTMTPSTTATNLDILRDHVPDESVDLVYLDPPFNSNDLLQRAVQGAVRALGVSGADQGLHRHLGVDPGVAAHLR